MKPQPSFDIDFDKHNNASLRIACPECGHETAHHLKSLSPDSDIFCGKCNTNITLDMEAIALASREAAEIRKSYGVDGGA
ncbi:hypothetical protein [Crenobacter intestini]|uniref:Uncharacterized protein n=1 Tax=Crenobacter intestini TaxID=2563443 RepID=A0A4T0V454_9NEIS|nr:hypothetical protein [Crenobacter intestini]TIC86127.1 hypothetical protein E5K04_03215 [Crenobacter intestini]